MDKFGRYDRNRDIPSKFIECNDEVLDLLDYESFKNDFEMQRDKYFDDRCSND